MTNFYSAYLRNYAAKWILADNLRLFLRSTLRLINVTLDEEEWDAIRFGAKDFNLSDNPWYDYTFEGTERIAFQFATHLETEAVHIVTDCSALLGIKISAFETLFQHYRAKQGLSSMEALVSDAFAEASLPGSDNIVTFRPSEYDFERRDAFDFFNGKQWLSLVEEHPVMPIYDAGIQWLTLNAKIYFFPAYIISAIRQTRSETLETALSAISEPSRQLTVLQASIIEFVISDLKRQETTGLK